MAPPKKSGNTKVVKSTDKDSDVEATRIAGKIEEIADTLPEKVRPYVKMAAPYLAKAWIYFLIALPYMVKGVKKLQELATKLPEKIVWAVVGFVLCFFGGVFPATVAAFEAWSLCGGSEALEQARVLFEEFAKVADASKKDDAKDEDKDNDGKADKDAELTPQQLVQKKLLIALEVMEPEKVSGAISCLYVGWIGVIGVLKVQFARTVALGDVIGQKIYKAASRLEPAIEAVVPKEYQKWVPTCTRWTCKLFAMSIAWFIQRIISAFHSAVRGGLMFGEYLVDYLHEQKILKDDSKNTFVDEAIGWSLAMLGLLTQIACGFQLPFIMNIVLWPAQLVEAFVVWSVSF